jgi:hypothetical protein
MCSSAWVPCYGVLWRGRISALYGGERIGSRSGRLIPVYMSDRERNTRRRITHKTAAPGQRSVTWQWWGGGDRCMARVCVTSQWRSKQLLLLTPSRCHPLSFYYCSHQSAGEEHNNKRPVPFTYQDWFRWGKQDMQAKFWFQKVLLLTVLHPDCSSSTHPGATGSTSILRFSWSWAAGKNVVK